jgi:hypothetical protein
MRHREYGSRLRGRFEVVPRRSYPAMLLSQMMVGGADWHEHAMDHVTSREGYRAKVKEYMASLRISAT